MPHHFHSHSLARAHLLTKEAGKCSQFCHMATPTCKGGWEMQSGSVTGGRGMSAVKSQPVSFMGPSIPTSCSKQGNSDFIYFIYSILHKI